jgi:hypothetical protein
MSAAFIESLFRLGKSHVILTGPCSSDIVLPGMITLEGARRTEAKDHDVIVVPTSKLKSSRLAEDYAVSGSPVSCEFVPNRLVPILCRRCAAGIVSNANKCLPLPSEQWIELSELWVCHPLPQEHPNADQPYGIQIKPIYARPGVILVGKEYYLVHEDDCDHVRVIAEGILVCKECNAPIGTRDQFGYRLLKFELASGADVRLERLYSVERCVAEQLVESQANKNMCRILLTSLELFPFDERDLDTEEFQGIRADFAVCLTLFDWNISIWSSDWPHLD